MWCENEKMTIATRSGIGTGVFGVPGQIRSDGKIECHKWYSCRDGFQNQTQDLAYFWYGIGKTQGKNVDAFIDKIETKLKLKKKTRMGPTNRSNCIWVRWAPFWRKYSLRRSLFTALMRVAICYDPKTDNYEEAIHSCKYFTNSRLALDYFLEGNTVYTGPASATGSNGWTYKLAHRTEDQLPKLLRKPVKVATA